MDRKAKTKINQVKPLPNAADVEEVVIGALMLEPDMILEVEDILTPEVFYNPTFSLIYKTIITIHAEGKPVDIMTVTVALRKMDKLDAVGGPIAISELTNRVASAANLRHHALIVRETYMQREVIKTFHGLYTNAYKDDADIFDMLAAGAKEIARIQELKFARNEESVFQVLSTLKDTTKAENNKKATEPVPTGFKDIDSKVLFLPGDLVIIGARPGMGKTSLAVNMARNAAAQGFPALIFSLEMPSYQLAARMMSEDMLIPVADILTDRLNDYQWEQFDDKLKKFKDLNLYLDDTQELTISELRNKARKAVRKYGIRMIVVDYLQLLDGEDTGKKFTTRDEQLGQISRGLKKMAKELGVPVIALAQLSREVEKRKDRRPLLTDIRESGNIEQDADKVLFPYRPEYYGEATVIISGQKVNAHGVCELIIPKNRNGNTGVTYLGFVAPITKFIDWNNGSASYEVERIEQSIKGGPSSERQLMQQASPLFNDEPQDGELPF